MKKIMVIFLSAAMFSCSNSADNTTSPDTSTDGTTVRSDTTTNDRLIGDSIVVPDQRSRQGNINNDSASHSPR
jgi:hypothetical protein